MTQYRISIRSHQKLGVKTYTGAVRYYDAGKFLYRETAGINRLTEEDAREDAYKLVDDKREQSKNLIIEKKA